MSEFITEVEFVDGLRRMSEVRQQKEIASDIGMSAQFLSDVIRGRRSPTSVLAGKLGYERVILFRKLKKARKP
jgi:hypothetical protein